MSPIARTPTSPQPRQYGRVDDSDYSSLLLPLSIGAVILVVLGILAYLYRKGLIFQGSTWKRRKSHAQPWNWNHWGSGRRSRLPSVFDLFHYPQRRKSTMHPEHPAHAAAAAATVTTDVGTTEHVGLNVYGRRQRPNTVTANQGPAPVFLQTPHSQQFLGPDELPQPPQASQPHHPQELFPQHSLPTASAQLTSEPAKMTCGVPLGVIPE